MPHKVVCPPCSSVASWGSACEGASPAQSVWALLGVPGPAAQACSSAGARGASTASSRAGLWRAVCPCCTAPHAPAVLIPAWAGGRGTSSRHRAELRVSRGPEGCRQDTGRRLVEVTAATPPVHVDMSSWSQTELRHRCSLKASVSRSARLLLQPHRFASQSSRQKRAEVQVCGATRVIT